MRSTPHMPRVTGHRQAGGRTAQKHQQLPAKYGNSLRMTTYRDHVTGGTATDSPCLPFHRSRQARHRRAGEQACRGPVRALSGAGEIPASGWVGTFGLATGGSATWPLSIAEVEVEPPPATPKAPHALRRWSVTTRLTNCFRKASCANLARKGSAVVCRPGGWPDGRRQPRSAAAPACAR